MTIATSNRQWETDSFAMEGSSDFQLVSLPSRNRFSSASDEHEDNASRPIVPSNRTYLEIPFDRLSMPTWRTVTNENLGKTGLVMAFYPNSIVHRETTTALVTHLQDVDDTSQPFEGDNHTEGPWSESFIRMQRALRARSLTDRDTFSGWERFTQLTDALSARWLEGIPTEATPHRAVLNPREFDDLAAELRASFLNEPVEDGFTHPAEDILTGALSMGDSDATLEWLLEFATDEARPTFAAYTLQCLGRLETGIPFEWRQRLVQAGLRSPNLAIRDVAAQAVDTWGDRGLIPILMAHKDPVPWLAEYINDIVADLSA